MPGASTANGTNVALLKGNVSGAVQQIPAVTVINGRERCFIETITLAAQASGTRIAVARIPLLAAIIGIIVIADTVNTATLTFGDYNDDVRWSGAAAAVAAANTPQTYTKTAGYGVPIVTGYDSDTGRTDKGYEDVIMVTGTAALPASGTMRVKTTWVLD